MGLFQRFFNPRRTPEQNRQVLASDALPKHVAMIMDGNGRWAQSRGLPRIEGHRRGADTVRSILEECRRLKIGCLTLYCFSNENWKRPKSELDFLMRLLERYLVDERESLIKQNIRLKIVGRRDGLPKSVLAEMDKSLEATAGNTEMTLCLAINYGSRQELVDTVRRVAVDVKEGILSPEKIDEEAIRQRLYTHDLPDPDLLIRTSGEMRISNFLLWQISYSELYITPTTWPEFTVEHFHVALQEYAKRRRRFGGLDAALDVSSP